MNYLKSFIKEWGVIHIALVGLSRQCIFLSNVRVSDTYGPGPSLFEVLFVKHSHLTSIRLRTRKTG